MNLRQMSSGKYRMAWWVVLVGLLWGGMAAGQAAEESSRCEVCNQVLKGEYYVVTDRSVGGEKKVCKDCQKLETRCFLCGLPVKGDYATLKDGRLLCKRDNKEAIHSETEAKSICEVVHYDLDRKFSRFMTFPSQDVVLSFVDRFHLESLFKVSGYEHCVSIFGATESHALGAGTNYVHSISILSDLKKARLMAVYAHECTHAWMAENVPKARAAGLARDTIEGFCELVAYELMEEHQEAFEMNAIKSNDYTKGQIGVLLEAEGRYGFGSIVDWMKAGEDSRLESVKLDRVRMIEPSLTVTPAASPALWTVAARAPTPVPNTLTLKGISGTSQHRFALINDRTFEVMEKGRVRFGQTNVAIRCLEIRDNSVVIQAGGSNEKQELFISNK
ncbi:MAG: zinc-binding protein [Pedosphaera sp.]|nr:zinc-binding protein [Pedosphaera sp.]